MQWFLISIIPTTQQRQQVFEDGGKVLAHENFHSYENEGKSISIEGGPQQTKPIGGDDGSLV